MKLQIRKKKHFFKNLHIHFKLEKIMQKIIDRKKVQLMIFILQSIIHHKNNFQIFYLQFLLIEF